MKKQILIFAAIITGFFTACEQSAVIDTEVITQEQEMPQPPQEALDALEALIDSDFAEAEIEDRCNDDHFGIVAQGEWLGAATWSGVNLAFYGGRNGTPTWFYYR